MKDVPQHCKRGHPWPENLKLNAAGRRYCAECLRSRPRKRFCPRGHEYTPENIYYTNQGYRLCKTCSKQSNNTPRPVSEATLRRVFERLNEGGTISSVYGKWTSPGNFIVTRHSLMHFMNQHPAVKQRIMALAKRNRPISYQFKRYGTRPLITAPGILRNNGEDAFAAVTRATSGVWEGERGDVMSLMFVAIAEGRLLPKDAAARLPEFVKLHRYRPRVYGDRSLDAPLYDDSSLTLGDNITRGMWQ